MRMKKFKDVEYSQLILGLYIILIGLLIVVLLPILKDSISIILAGKELSSPIRAEITSTILAVSTIILVIITAGYAKSTKELVDEQVKLRKIASFEKVLENVYSPLDNALNKFRLSNDSLPRDRIPENYNSDLNALNGDILKISDKYYHLIKQEIKNRYNDLWKSWDIYKRDATLENYNLLNSRINLFNAEITKHFNIEKKSLNNLQKYQNDINSDNDKKINSLEKEAKYNSKFIFVLCLIILIVTLFILINEDQIGPTSQYDWIYFEKKIPIKNENSNESLGSLDINGVVRSRGIISPAKPTEFMIFEIDFRSVKTEFLPTTLCEGYICKKNVTVSVCLQSYNARGYNKSELVEYPYLRREFPCIENIKLYNQGDDGFAYVSYSNNKSLDLNKEIVFITSGPQSLRIDNFFGHPYDIENVFEVNPYHFYSELQLNKYAFLLALIGLIVVIIDIIKFFGFGK
ncbi:MAG: hypothetical protein WA130_02055 [Candidatus Methanoperedens sp.]